MNTAICWDATPCNLVYSFSALNMEAVCSPTFFGTYPPYSFHFRSLVCLTTRPKPLTKRALHIVRSRASSFKWEYPLLSLRLSSSFLRLLPHLPVTSMLPFIFPSITRFRRQFLCKLWPIQLAFRLRISCGIFLCSLTLNPLKPKDIKRRRTAQLTSRCCILYIYSTNIRTEYFKHAA